jgi:hypothetical protein
MKYVIITLIALFTLLPLSSIAENKAQYSTDKKIQQYSEAQLAQMLAPIALYPDTLLTHVLIASTYPLELVQAQRWLDKHDGLSADRLAEKLEDEMEDKNWDASIKALMAFPSVVARLSDDLEWTQQLGEAFLSDEAQVLASIQQLRKQAQQAGNLSKMANSVVSYDGSNIVIEPQKTQVIYVPYYDSRQVYGRWHWSHYPPVYWAIPSQFYSGHYASHYGSPYRDPFYWHAAVHIRHHFFFRTFHWHKRHVVMVNHRNKRHYGYRRHNRYPDYNRAKIVTSTGAKRWHYKPQHRRGVAFNNKRLTKRFKQRVHAKKHNAHLLNRTIKRGKMSKARKIKSTKHYQATKVAKHHKQGKGYNKQAQRQAKSARRDHQKQQKKVHQSRNYQAKKHSLKRPANTARTSKSVRHNTVRNKTVRHSVVKHSSVKHSSVKNNRKVERRHSTNKRHLTKRHSDKRYANKSHRIASSKKVSHRRTGRQKER